MGRLHRKTIVLSVGYWFGAHTLGFLVHPYQSVRRIVREQFYRPLVWLPSVSLLVWWIFGVLAAHFNIMLTLRLDLLAGNLDKWSFKQTFFSFVFVWGAVFLICWQVLLSYLYWRFSSALRKQHE